MRSETVRPGKLIIEIKGPGTLDALSQAALGSRLQARIETLAVDRNDVVSKGDVLGRLAFDELAGGLAAAEASAHASERAVDTAGAERDHALASLDKARATHERQVALVAKGVASQAGLDDAAAIFRQAQADLVRARRAIEQAEAEREAARARIAVARAQLDDSVLRAPIDGIVISRTHHPGEVVAPGSEPLRIADPTSLVLNARLDESAIASVQAGQLAHIRFSGFETPINGHVLRLGREVDEETREFELDIALDRLPPNWALGQRGTVRIEVEERPDVLTVPQTPGTPRRRTRGLARAERAGRWQAVTLGSAGGARVEVRGGLEGGDIVLAPEGLHPFMRLRVADSTP
ncbi:efflux RND transporter periplasmic adaptor subunit [Ancylobacter dichloromethanicus]|uniref:efflux RND transporter periplasmic adaptor subunit n=1 Tax=Ancylobacter dichloromethanicus TaxID=518825 RepID=UPI00361C478E